MSNCVKCATPLTGSGRYCPTCGADNSGDTGTGKSLWATPPSPDPDLEQKLRAELADQFVVEREIGRGGMGLVFLATESRLGRRVAIKVLPPSFSLSVLSVERFLREARTAATLDHPHIIPIHRVSDGGALHWYAMKYVEGESLGDLLDREGRLPFSRAADLVVQAAEALQYAHSKGVVHRDVKPGNVMIAPDGWVTVTDFGIAKAAGTESITGSGSMVGTPLYMSPEQCAGTELSSAADQYSLAVVAFQMVGGELPFTGESAVDIIKKHCFDPAPSLAQYRADAPPQLAAVVGRALAKHSGERFPSVKEFADAFARAARGEPVDLPSVERGRPPLWRRPLVWGSSAVVAVLGVVGLALTLLRAPRPKVTSPPPDSARTAAPVAPPRPIDTVPERPLASPPTQRPAAPTAAVEVGYITVGSVPLAPLTINGKVAPSNPVANYAVPAGTVRLHFEIMDSIGKWTYDTTVAVAPRERRTIGRVRLVRP